MSPELLRARIKGGEPLMDMDLRDLVLTPGDYAGAIFMRCDLRGLRLAGLDLRDSQFVRCQLQETVWDGARLDQCVFHGCDASGASMRVGHVEEMSWSESLAVGIDMAGTHCVSVNFVKTDMTDASLAGASLKQSSFTECAWGQADMGQ